MSILQTVDPRGMTAKGWCDAMTLSLISVGQLPHIRKDADWKQWATAVITVLGPSVTQIPDPLKMPDWRMWAQQLNQVLNAGL